MAARRPPPVARVIERLTRTVRAHQMLAPGDLVLVWVSGGPDSICLLESLVRVRRLFRIRLAVFHLDHGLHDRSARAAAYVRRRADEHGLRCFVREPTTRPRRGASVERWAREERRLAAAEVAASIGADRSALGHTMDDRAETVLLGLLRGWGLDGLTGIEPVAGSIVRPLLDVRRTETVACCRALRLRPHADPSNEETTYLRNAIRLEVLPTIAATTGRDPVPTIARTAELLRADATLLDELAIGLGASATTRTMAGWALDVEALSDLAPPIAARVVRRSLAVAGIDWSQATIEGIVDLAAGRPGRRIELGDGWVARRERARIAIER